MKVNKSQTTLGYILLIIVIIGAVIAMSVYIKRAAQGRLKSSADVFGLEEQYDIHGGTTEEVLDLELEGAAESGLDLDDGEDAAEL